MAYGIVNFNFVVLILVPGEFVEDDSFIGVGIPWVHLFRHFLQKFDELLLVELLLFDFHIVFIIVVVLL